MRKWREKCRESALQLSGENWRGTSKSDFRSVNYITWQCENQITMSNMTVPKAIH